MLVFEDATIGNNKFHPSTPSLGIRHLPQRKGFDILLLDEYRTSSRWPPLQIRSNLSSVIEHPIQGEAMTLHVWPTGYWNVGVRNLERSLMVKNVARIAIYLQRSTFWRFSMAWEAHKADLFTLLEEIKLPMHFRRFIDLHSCITTILDS